MSARTEGKDSETLARDLDATRGDISETLDALQAKLSPGAILDRTLATVRGGSLRAADRVSRSVAQNPWPLLAAGIGLIWIIVGGSLDLSSTRFGRSARTRRWAKRWASSAGFIRRNRLPTPTGRASAMHAPWTGGDRRWTRAPTAAAGFLDDRPLLTGTLAVALVVALGYAMSIVGSGTTHIDESD
jgi:hypothetical protein